MKQYPRVTEEEVKAAIKKAEYTLLQDGRTTICLITLDNGYTVRGESSCVCKENYEQELGERFSYERAFNKAWEMMGFRLADRLHQKRMRKARGARYRDSESGLYVTKEYAKLNPSTTEKEM